MAWLTGAQPVFFPGVICCASLQCPSLLGGWGAGCCVGYGSLRLLGVPSVFMCVRVCTYMYITEVLCRVSFGGSGLVNRWFCNAFPLALVLPVSRAINNQQLWAALVWMSVRSLCSGQEVSGPPRSSRPRQGWKFHDLAGVRNVCVIN